LGGGERWQRGSWAARDLGGWELGVVGLGRRGTSVARELGAVGIELLETYAAAS